MQTINIPTSIINTLLEDEIRRYIALIEERVSQPDYEFLDEPVHNHIALERESLVVSYGDAAEENGSALSASAKLWLGNLDKSSGYPVFTKTGTAKLSVSLGNLGWDCFMVVERSPASEVR